MVRNCREWWGYNATMTAVPVHHADTSTAQALDTSGLSIEWPITSELGFEQDDARIIPRFDIDVCDDFRVFGSQKAVSDLANLQKKVITEYLESNDYLSLRECPPLFALSSPESLNVRERFPLTVADCST